jgi:hypothetical protein
LFILGELLAQFCSSLGELPAQFSSSLLVSMTKGLLALGFQPATILVDYAA